MEHNEKTVYMKTFSALLKVSTDDQKRPLEEYWRESTRAVGDLQARLVEARRTMVKDFAEATILFRASNELAALIADARDSMDEYDVPDCPKNVSADQIRSWCSETLRMVDGAALAWDQKLTKIANYLRGEFQTAAD